MSRCFQFPPPGYGIKPRCDDASLIPKKQKKKKHKEKGEEEKKVRGSTKENRSSENKHKEDKDPNKKKHKKDKKKDEWRSSKEKRLFENQDSQKLSPHIKYCNGIREDKFLDEMGRRIRNDGEAANNGMVWKPDFRAAPDDGSNVILAESYSNIKDKKEPTRMDNGGNLKGDARCMGHDFGNSLEKNENRFVVDAGSCQLDKVRNGKKGKEKREEHNSVGNKVDMPKNEDRDKNRKAKERGKEKIKQRPTTDCNFPEDCNYNPKNLPMAPTHPNSLGKLPKHREPVSNGISHENGHQASNLYKAGLCGHQVSQNRTSLHPSQISANLAVKRGEKVDAKFLSSQSVNEEVESTEASYSANKSTADNGRGSVRIGRKTELWPSNGKSKLEPIVHSHNAVVKFEACPLVENGRKTAGSHIERHKMDITSECKRDTALKPSAKEKVSATVKPPHPDLSQILTLPGLEWSQFDDQEWLFGRIDSPAKKPKLASTPISVTKPVWTDARQVESVDVIAMPYVVPY